MGNDDPVSRARANPAAFADLYEAYRLPVFRFLRSMSPTEEEAADMTAVTFERVFRGLSSYRPAGTPLAWVLRIARNAAVDSARRRRPTSSFEEAAPVTQADAETPEAKYLSREQAAELRRLVQALPELQRHAIALRYVNDLTAREIGAVIGKSESAAQKLLTRALAALKEAYDGDNQSV